MRIYEYNALKRLVDIAHLRGVRLEEFPSCRHVEE